MKRVEDFMVFYINSHGHKCQFVLLTLMVGCSTGHFIEVDAGKEPLIVERIRRVSLCGRLKNASVQSKL